ncbi:MAG: OmpH family outer membrane protein [Bacteroidaceae bacterium]|nr:OmpH family outer membrane protein [Bacteroidaceae bacterium]
MMKKLILVFLACLPLSAMAQHFGYVDYDAILKEMPEYAETQEYMKELKDQYQTELRHSEEEFNRKYNEFLDGQKDFAETILVKRQKELQGLYEAGLAFRRDCEGQLKEAEEKLVATVKVSLNKAIKEVASELGLDYVLNTSNQALLYAGPNGKDITEQVKTKLHIQ